MKNRTLRAALVIAAFGALVVGGYTILQAERAIRETSAATMRFDERTVSLMGQLDRLHASQQAYVAQGQGADFWMARADELLASVARELELLVSAASTDAARTAMQSVTATMEEFRRLDARAREYVGSEQLLMASDLIFTEGHEAAEAGRKQVIVAREQELGALETQAAALRGRQLYAAAGAAAVLVLALLLLAPVPQADVDVLTAMRALTSTPAAAGAAARPVAPEPLVQDEFGGIVSPARPASQAPAARAPEPAPEPAPAMAEAPLLAVVPAVDLHAAARVCAEMARVLDAADLPDLLSRAASVLDAPGLIVWVSDKEGRELYPLLTHGYSAHMVLRLGTIPAGADNATAHAWRTAHMGTVPGDDGQASALVAPIVTADGCVGALSAELASGREQQADVQALATIFAAQLATFVTALPTEQRAQAVQG